MTLAIGLLTVTAVFVASGCLLYAVGSAGWAQLLWVMASGTAGAGVMRLLDKE